MTLRSGINKNWKPDSLKRKKEAISYYVAGIRSSNHAILSESITLLENLNTPEEFKLTLLHELSTTHKGDSTDSLRIGISGSPGVGKSTFIDSFGKYLIDQNRKVAVLAIDPSSELTKGSILGDKTRMHRLTADQRAFIRPTPSSNLLGGIAPVTKESILLCEAAGFDTILIETVGVGQSETHLRSIVDIFCLLLLPGAGDDLQGIKKGIVEISDLFIINKADGNRELLAKESQKFYKNALHLQRASSSKWIKEILTCSALEGKGLENIWTKIQEYKDIAIAENRFVEKRKEQDQLWVENKKNAILFKAVSDQFKSALEHNSQNTSTFNELIVFKKFIEERLNKLEPNE